MKRQILVRGLCAGMAGCLCIGLLAGCKERTVDYDIAGTTESGLERIDSDGETGLKQFTDVIADAPLWKEAGKVTLSDGNEYFWEVDAEISVPDTNQMYVVDVEECCFDEAAKEQIAEKLFGEEIYYYDTAHLTKEDLAELQNRLQMEYDATSDTSKRKEVLAEQISECGENMETAGDVYIPVYKYDVDEYLGKREGISYELSFEENETIRFAHTRSSSAMVTYGRGRSASLVPKDICQVCPEEVSGVENLFYSVEDLDEPPENQCKISEEEAQKLAQSFVEGLESDYSVYSGSETLYWYNGEHYADQALNYIADGYVFYFDAGIEDVSFVQYGTQADYYWSENEFYLEEHPEEKRDEKSEELQYFMKARLEIYVNENGIIAMNAENPVRVTYVTDAVKLLPLETIKGIIREYMLMDLDRSLIWMEPNELKLIYFRVRDKENPGHYCYVPTWRFACSSFHDENGNAEMITSALLINAIDGSVIDYFDET